MKKKLFFLISCLFLVTVVFAQPRPVRNAEKELNKGNIALAKEMIDEAMNDSKAQEDGRSYLIRSKIYMAIFASEDSEIKNLHDDPLAIAWESVMKAPTLSKVNPAMVTAEILMLAGHYFNSGAINFDNGNFSRASQDLEMSFNLNKNYLNNIDTLHYFYAGIAAQSAKEFDRAETIYKELLEMEYDEPDLYAQIASLHNALKNFDIALEYVNKGRERYPDNLQLVFNEINVHLAAENPQKAMDALELAISLDPDNANLLFVMGSNFTTMVEKAITEEERVFAFNEAEKAYLQALEINPDYFDATFNLGVLYFNEGVRLFTIANDLFANWSRENERLALEKEKEAAEYWHKSEPFFLHARDLLMPNDPNTEFVSRSLKELYLRTGQTEKYQEVIDEFGE